MWPSSDEGHSSAVGYRQQPQYASDGAEYEYTKTDTYTSSSPPFHGQYQDDTTSSLLPGHPFSDDVPHQDFSGPDIGIPMDNPPVSPSAQRSYNQESTQSTLSLSPYSVVISPAQAGLPNQNYFFLPGSLPISAAHSPYSSQEEYSPSPSSIGYQLSAASSPFSRGFSLTEDSYLRIDESYENHNAEATEYLDIPSYTHYEQASTPAYSTLTTSQPTDDSNRRSIYPSRCSRCDNDSTIYQDHNTWLVHYVEIHEADLFPRKCLWEGCKLQKKFKRPKHWLSHARSVHLKNIWCDVSGCSYDHPFGNQAMVDRHKKQTHNGAKNCTRPGCQGRKNSNLARRDKLLDHNFKWHGPLECKDANCLRRTIAGVDHGFSTEEDLTKHMREKHYVFGGSVRHCSGLNDSSNYQSF